MCLPELGFAQAKNPYQHYTHSPNVELGLRKNSAKNMFIGRHF